MTKKYQKTILLLSIIILNFGVDQISKIIARANLQGAGEIKIIGAFFKLVYAENTGAFLGIGSNIPQPWKTIVLVLFPAIAIILATLYLIFGKKVSMKQAVCLACIIGGGMGNVLDRAVHSGAVTDFLLFNFYFFRTGVLNIADLSITFGAILLLIFQYIEEKKEKDLLESANK